MQGYGKTVTLTDATKMEICPACGNCAAYWETLHDDRHGFPGHFAYYRCDSCGGVFHRENMNDEQMRRLYSEYYPRSSFSTADWQPYDWSPSFRSWLAGRSSAYMYVPKNVRVLDIGCGTGQSLGYHRNRGCSAHGTEMDQNAQRIAEAWGLDIKLSALDVASWGAGSFDYVTLDQVLEHNADPAPLLQSIQQVLKPDGTLLLTTPNARSFTATRYGRNWIHWHPPYHCILYTRASLNAVLKKAGFTVNWMRTVTPSSWLQYQYLHGYFAVAEGERSRFWDPRVPKDFTKKERRILWGSERLLRYHIFSVIARTLDGCGVGDSLIVSARPDKKAQRQTGDIA